MTRESNQINHGLINYQIISRYAEGINFEIGPVIIYCVYFLISHLLNEIDYKLFHSKSPKTLNFPFFQKFSRN